VTAAANFSAFKDSSSPGGLGIANLTITVPAGCKAGDWAVLVDDEEQEAVEKKIEAKQIQMRLKSRYLFFITL
jgi:hypothetical protein